MILKYSTLIASFLLIGAIVCHHIGLLINDSYLSLIPIGGLLIKAGFIIFTLGILKSFKSMRIPAIITICVFVMGEILLIKYGGFSISSEWGVPSYPLNTFNQMWFNHTLLNVFALFIPPLFLLIFLFKNKNFIKIKNQILISILLFFIGLLTFSQFSMSEYLTIGYRYYQDDIFYFLGRWMTWMTNFIELPYRLFYEYDVMQFAIYEYDDMRAALGFQLFKLFYTLGLILLPLYIFLNTKHFEEEKYLINKEEDVPKTDTEEQAKPKKASAPKSEEVDIEKELEKYKRMLDKGLITEEEYEAKKKELLGL